MTIRCLWLPPGSPFPAWADHPDRATAETHAADVTRETGAVVTVFEIGGEE